jgi:hypothetical protein
MGKDDPTSFHIFTFPTAATTSFAACKIAFCKSSIVGVITMSGETNITCAKRHIKLRG